MNIHDVQVVNLKTFVDERGFLYEMIHATDPFVHKFGQVYIVGDEVRGAIRAFHKHRQLHDWFCIVHGTAKFVLVDDRPESPTYKKMDVIVIGKRNPSVIVVPPGIYHGWMSLEDDTLMVSAASEIYNREQPDEERVAPDAFGDVWTVKGK